MKVLLPFQMALKEHIQQATLREKELPTRVIVATLFPDPALPVA